MSKKILRYAGLALLFITLFPVPGYPQTGEDSGEKSREVLKRVFESRGIPYEDAFLFSVSGKEDEGLPDTGTSMLIRFRRPEMYDEASPLFIAALSLEGPPAAEGALPYRFRTALELIEKIRRREAAGQSLPVDMMIAFLGAGDLRAAADYRSGSGGDFAAYGDSIEDPEQTVFLYLDLGEFPLRILIHHGTGETVAPLHMVADLPGLCGSLNIPAAFAVPFTELYKLRLTQGPDLLRFVQGQEIKGLVFSGSGTESPAAADPGEKIPEESLAELLIRYAGSLKKSGEIPDYHYAVFPLPGRPLFFSQERIVLLLLLTAGSLFLGFLWYRGFRRPPPARLRIFFRCFWVIPALLFLLFVCFTGAGLAAALFFKGGEEAGVSQTYGWAGCRLLLALGIFFLSTIPLERYRIPRKANFYGVGAFLIILLDTLIAAWTDIALTPFFIGALVLILLGMAVKFAVPVFFCAFLSPFYGILALLAAIQSGDSAPGTWFLSTTPAYTLMTALVFLPFILLFKRGLILARRGRPKIPLRLSLIPPLLLLAAAGILAVFLSLTS